MLIPLRYAQFPVVLMGLGASLLFAGGKPAAAQYATLSLQSQPGDFIGHGQNYDILYVPNPASFFTAYVSKTIPSGAPGEIVFDLGYDNYKNPFAALYFGTDQLGIPLQPGTYTDVQRADFTTPGHPGLDIAFAGSGCDTVTGNFTINDFTYTALNSGNFTIDTFDATFEQHCNGAAPALFGEFSYRGAGTPPIPEASTTVSFGLLLALGTGSVIVAARKRKTASA